MKRYVFAAIGSCVLLLRPSGGRASPVNEVDPGRLDRGKSLFEAKGANCHGAKGDRRGPASHCLNPKPPALTSGIFKRRSRRDETAPTDEDLFRALSHGIPGTSMPRWAHLSLRSRHALVAEGYRLRKWPSVFAKDSPRSLGWNPQARVHAGVGEVHTEEHVADICADLFSLLPEEAGDDW